jgi:hypothetical protein
MRWFRRGSGRQSDPGAGQAIVDDVRERFGAHLPGSFREQAEAVVPLLSGDEGVAAAAAILREFADSAYADLVAQTGFPIDRTDYRSLWRDGRGRLRWQLFTLPCRLHPYIQVSAAAGVLSTEAKRAVRQTEPGPLLAHVLEVLDLTIDGWEFARVRPDTDGAILAHRLIAAARDLRGAMSDEPPLPRPVRELMRRNHVVDIYDPESPQVVGGFNPGKEMREALLA